MNICDVTGWYAQNQSLRFTLIEKKNSDKSKKKVNLNKIVKASMTSTGKNEPLTKGSDKPKKEFRQTPTESQKW